MDQQSILSSKWKSLQVHKMPVGLSATTREEPPSTFVSTTRTRPKKGPGTPRVFTKVRLLPEDSYGVHQVSSKVYNAFKRKSVKRVPITTPAQAQKSKSKTVGAQKNKSKTAAAQEPTSILDQKVDHSASSAQPAEIHVSHVQPGENHVSGAQLAENHVSLAQPAENLVSRAQPAENRVSRAQPAENRVSRARPAENRVSRAQPLSNRVSHAQPADNRASRAQPADNRASRAQPVGNFVSRSESKAPTPTTMTGLPWRIRHKLEGRPATKPSSHLLERPTLGNYTFTYDLTKEDEALLRGEIPLEYSLKPQIRDRSYYKSNLPETWGHDQDSEDEGPGPSARQAAKEARDRAAAKAARDFDELHKNEVFLHEYLVAKRHPHSKNLLASTRNILRQTGLMPDNIDDDMIKYYQDLERMEYRPDPGVIFGVSKKEREEARKAFTPAVVVKQSRIQPETYYEVRRKLESTRDMLKEKKKVRLLTDSMEDLPKEPEPPIHLFTPSFNIRAADQERLIDEQLLREEENSPQRRIEHDRRKRELMEAALQVYDPETEAYERAMKAVSESPSDVDSLGAAGYDPPTSYYYNKLTNQFQLDEGSGPKTTLHLIGLSKSRYDVFGPRPLDQANLKGPLISTVLREMEEDKLGGRKFPIKPRPKIEGAVEVENKHAKGLQALENYKLSQARQKTIHHKPVITMPNLAAKYDSNGVAMNWSAAESDKQAAALHTHKSIAPTLYQTQEYFGEKPPMSPIVRPTHKKVLNGNDSLVPSRGSLHSLTFEARSDKPKPKPRIPPTKKKTTGAKKKVTKPTHATTTNTTARKHKRYA